MINLSEIYQQKDWISAGEDKHSTKNPKSFPGSQMDQTLFRLSICTSFPNKTVLFTVLETIWSLGSYRFLQGGGRLFVMAGHQFFLVHLGIHKKILIPSLHALAPLNKNWSPPLTTQKILVPHKQAPPLPIKNDTAVAPLLLYFFYVAFLGCRTL